MFYVMTKVTCKNGNTSDEILCVPDLSTRLPNGDIRARLSRLIALRCCGERVARRPRTCGRHGRFYIGFAPGTVFSISELSRAEVMCFRRADESIDLVTKPAQERNHP